MMATETTLTVRELAKDFKASDGARRVLSGVTFEVARGERVALVGRSGAGKSTLLSIIAGFLEPTEGTVSLGPPEACRVSFIFQDDGLLPWMTVLENAALAPRLAGDPSWRQAGLSCLEVVGMAERGGSWPKELSIGMRKRVEIARALAAGPSLLLADEPLAHLDPPARVELEELLISTTASRRIALLCATHDLESALALSSRVLILGGTPARLLTVFEAPWAGSEERPRRESQEFQTVRWELSRRMQAAEVAGA